MEQGQSDISDINETDELDKSFKHLEKQNDELSIQMDRALKLNKKGDKIRLKQLLNILVYIMIAVGVIIILFLLFDINITYY